MAARPPRVHLGSLATGDAFDAQYNPETFEEDLSAVYQHINPQGMSHAVLQFGHTESWSCSFDLAFDSFGASVFNSAAANPSDVIQKTRNILQSWVVPQRGTGSIASVAPTRVLFYWPGMISLAAVIEKLTFKHKRFAWTGVDLASTWFVVTVKLKEIRDTRLFAEDVARTGTIRSST